MNWIWKQERDPNFLQAQGFFLGNALGLRNSAMGLPVHVHWLGDGEGKHSVLLNQPNATFSDCGSCRKEESITKT